MKVPKMYKSSDRYNAGTDVIYDDDSKLQYAPFIYATEESGDNGDSGGGGDDEEGEDIMVVIYDETTQSIDKSFKDLKDALKSGKLIILDKAEVDDESGYQVNRYYLVHLENVVEGEYVAIFATVIDDDGVEVVPWSFTASTETDVMTYEQGNG